MPEFIESRYLAGTNQYDLELLSAAPEVVSFGTGESSSNLQTSSTLIQTTTKVIGSIGCPALDQWVLVQGDEKQIVPKLAGMLRAGDALYNPLTGNFNPVRSLSIIYQPTARVKGMFSETVVSWTHPLIVDSVGKTKRVEKCAWYEDVLIVGRKYLQVHKEQIVFQYAGERPTIRISLESEFIYATSKTDGDNSFFLLGHNNKDEETP